MKVLWITNTIFPELAQALGQKSPVVGGWMYSLAHDIIRKGVDLSVVTVRPNTQEIHHKIDEIDFYLLEGQKPILQYDSSLENKWKKLISKIKPDVVHIHGTEYAHGLALVKTCPELKVVISIQGMTSIYARYYKGQLTFWQIFKNLTLKDVIRQNSILDAQRKFKKRGEKIEMGYLSQCQHFIGRTQWDFDHVRSINPTATYHFCNESLRNSFYSASKWNLENINRHTLFLSQALYPIKGLHKVLEALQIVRREYPTIQIRIAGMNITKYSSFMDKIRIDGYGNYIRKIIKQNDLQNLVHFTGPLDEKEMVREYLSCHAFICPSSIENSPNSLGEAQLLGVPCIASYVGGIPDMVSHGETGLLYRFEEVEMLAQHIIRLFKDNTLAQSISKAAIKLASLRHNRENNSTKTIAIYNNIK
ncbi:glycosyltransferase family 4 protein [Maribacter dokdonensis]|uniref:glycosyltransferase family 4 protein n=1 Tax=Maribacter dokdonensis TaxID=320912 RepID=UPI002AAF50F7|nr:glycosyltransferase family 4 protein [Maribacter dokdonensis]